MYLTVTGAVRHSGGLLCGLATGTRRAGESARMRLTAPLWCVFVYADILACVHARTHARARAHGRTGAGTQARRRAQAGGHAGARAHVICEIWCFTRNIGPICVTRSFTRRMFGGCFPTAVG